MQAAGSLLQHRAHAGVSCTPLLTPLNVSVLQIPRDKGGGSGPTSRKMVGSGALWVHICLAGGGG